MNIVTHCPAELAFLYSHDVSDEKHNASYIYKFVDQAIKDAGPEIMVQIVTNCREIENPKRSFY